MRLLERLQEGYLVILNENEFKSLRNPVSREFTPEFIDDISKEDASKYYRMLELLPKTFKITSVSKLRFKVAHMKPIEFKKNPNSWFPEIEEINIELKKIYFDCGRKYFYATYDSGMNTLYYYNKETL